MRRSLVPTLVASTALALTALAPPALAAGPAPVGGAHVTAQDSTSVTLSWTAPAGAAVEIRELRGSGLPGSPTAGAHVTRVRAPRHSVTVGRLAPGARYGFALFTVDAHGGFSRGVGVRAVTAPAAVSDVQASEDSRGTLLAWTLPRTRTLARVVVRYAAGPSAPVSTVSGTGVRLTGATVRTARLTGLHDGARYSASVFTLDRAGRASTPSVVRFTTPSDRVRQGTVTGRVTDTSGDPLAGVEVGVDDFRDGGEPHATTGADGVYSLSLLPDDAELTLAGQHISGGTTDAAGYQPTYEGVTVVAGRTVHQPDVRLAPGAAVRGRVVGPDGAALSGATVYVQDVRPYVEADSDGADGSSASFTDDATEVVTGTDGSYTLRGLDGRAGAERVCAGFDAQQLTSSCSTHSFEPVPGAVTAAADLPLSAEPSGSISGVVRAGSHGIGGVHVTIQAVDDHVDGYADVYTSGDGHFDAQYLPVGRYRVCTAAYSGGSGTGYTSVCGATVPVTANGTASVTLVPRVGAAISGVVRGPGGHAIADAYVSSGPAHDLSYLDGGSAITDARGRYRIAGLTAAPQVVCVRTPNTPLAGAATGAKPGCLAGGHPQAVRAGATRTDGDVSLSVGAEISGTARDSHGRPVAGVLVSADQDSGASSGTGDDVTGANGRYVIAGLPAGKYDVCDIVLPPGDSGYFTWIVGGCGRTVRATVGHNAVKNIALPATTGIAVTVRDASGSPVAGVDAAALAPCAGGDPEDEHPCFGDPVPVFDPKTDVAVAGSAVTGRDGSTVVDTAPGSYAVCLFAGYGTTVTGGSPTGYADRCSGSTFGVRVRAGAVTDLALTLGTGGAVTGRITDSAGHPLAGVRIDVADAASTDYPGAGEDDGSGDAPGSVVTAADGSYSVDGVVPGGRTVCADPSVLPLPAGSPGYLAQCDGGSSGDATRGTAVPVTAGSTTDAGTLALGTAAGLSGQVRSSTGAAAGYVDVTIYRGRDASDQIAEAEADRSGRWSATGLPPGPVTVCFLPGEYEGQCWKGAAWSDKAKDPPLARATLVTTVAGTLTTGIDARLTAGR